jgi:hypothetical protein
MTWLLDRLVYFAPVLFFFLGLLFIIFRVERRGNRRLQKELRGRVTMECQQCGKVLRVEPCVPQWDGAHLGGGLCDECMKAGRFQTPTDPHK